MGDTEQPLTYQCFTVKAFEAISGCKQVCLPVLQIMTKVMFYWETGSYICARILRGKCGGVSVFKRLF